MPLSARLWLSSCWLEPAAGMAVVNPRVGHKAQGLKASVETRAGGNRNHLCARTLSTPVWTVLGEATPAAKPGEARKWPPCTLGGMCTMWTQTFVNLQASRAGVLVRVHSLRAQVSSEGPSARGRLGGLSSRAFWRHQQRSLRTSLGRPNPQKSAGQRGRGSY